MKNSPIYDRARKEWEAKPGSAAYINTTDTAKLIRTVLKRKFPNTKFSVRSSKYSGGSSIRVGWTDGPTADLVDAYVKNFAGAGFDGMIDMKFYSDSWLYPDGSSSFKSTGGTSGSNGVYAASDEGPAANGAIPVSFSADYVFTERSYTTESLERALTAYRAKWGEEAAEGVTVEGDGSYTYMKGNTGPVSIEAAREVRAMAARRMLPVAMPQMEAA